MHARTHFSYAAFYSSKFVLLGIQLPFFSGWLALQGVSAPDIGLITGAALVARLALGPLVAYWADGQSDERLPLRLVAVFFAASAVSLTVAPDKLLITAAAVIMLWSFGLLVPLADSAVIRADRAGLANFGQARAIGSFAFLATTIAGGQALTRFGIEASVKIMAAAGAATLFIALILPRNQAPRPNKGRLSWRDARRLVSSPGFLVAILASGLTQGAHAFYYAFSILDWTAIGYSPGVIGLLWATGVTAEILLLTQMRALGRRIRPDLLMAIGAAGAALRWALTAAQPPLGLLFAVQTLHALSFAATYMGAIEFIDRAVPKHLANTAMTLNSTAGVGAITGVATIAAGYVYAWQGADAAYFLMSAMSAIACALAFFLSRLWKGGALFAAGAATS